MRAIDRFRPVRSVVAITAALAMLAACGSDPATEEKYHNGLLFLATGNTTGSYYQFGGGYADLVNKYVSGYEMRAEPTGASGENVERVSRGDMDCGLAHADIAADGVIGRYAFDGNPQRVAGMASLYNNIGQVVVRANLKIHSVAELKGRRVSTGTLNSGTDNVAGRMLEAAGINPDKDITRLRLSLAETTKGMKSGEIDALFFVAGLPTTGVLELVTSSPGQFVFLAADDLLRPMNDKYGDIYQGVTIPRSVYGTPADLPTVAIPTMLVCSPDLPDDLAHKLTAVIYDHQEELAAAHAEGANVRRAAGRLTNPVPLHPGARRYFDD